jgi:predicted component of type VI protein secretion system
VLKALDAIVDYYRRREPGSPVPVAIARAKSWVNLDFLSVLEDIAPDSVGEARRVLTSKRDEED